MFWDILEMFFRLQELLFYKMKLEAIGIPFRIVQIKGFVVNTETNQVLHICINRLYDLLMTCCLYEKVFTE